MNELRFVKDYDFVWLAVCKHDSCLIDDLLYLLECRAFVEVVLTANLDFELCLRVVTPFKESVLGLRHEFELDFGLPSDARESLWLIESGFCLTWPIIGLLILTVDFRLYASSWTLLSLSVLLAFCYSSFGAKSVKCRSILSPLRSTRDSVFLSSTLILPPATIAYYPPKH